MNPAYSSMTQQMLQAFQGQDLEMAERLAWTILKASPKDLIALQVHGLSLAMLGRAVESVAPLLLASQQDQENPELLSNLAKAQHEAGLYADAIETYKKLDKLLPNNPHILTDMGTNFAKIKNFDEAKKYYEYAIQINSEYFLAWSNQGNLLLELSFAEEALASYEKALGLNPGHAETWTSYGNAFFNLSRYQEARLAHEKALSLNPEYSEAWLNYANTLVELKDSGDYDAYQKAYFLKPNHPFLIGQFFKVATSRCDWENSKHLSKKIISISECGGRAAHPFIILQTNASASLQKICAETFVKDRFLSRPPFPVLKKIPRKGQKIRIGYFSSDFKEHPVGILIENILLQHNRLDFVLYGFFLNLSVGDDREKRLMQLFDQSFNIFDLNDSAALNLIRAQQLDIAIDLNGHTSGARMALFAEKLAPIQINYLGYAGTSGANFYDALIADEVVIPHADQEYYSEPIAYMTNSFFPADTSISLEDFGGLPSRSSQGLPEEGFVFGCFNKAYKITSPIFDIWMHILIEVSNSVLWLSTPSSVAALNLQKEAKKRGVDPSRLIFANRTVGRPEHLSRLRLADLFLDTPNYNAHATAADALWAGLPVLTLMGHTFAGRVAASQLRSLGLNELITHSEKEYFDKAVEFARHPIKLKVIRTQLEASRSSSTLFDTKQYVKDLESIYLGLLKSST